MVNAGGILSDDVTAWFNDLYTLNGKEATYKRFKEETYDPDTGVTSPVYETGTIELVKAPIRSWTIAQDSRLQQDDQRVIFKKSGFPNDDAKGDDEPTAKDIIIIDSDTWKLDINNEAVYETDDTDTMYFIYVRR